MSLFPSPGVAGSAYRNPDPAANAIVGYHGNYEQGSFRSCEQPKKCFSGSHPFHSVKCYIRFSLGMRGRAGRRERLVKLFSTVGRWNLASERQSVETLPQENDKHDDNQQSSIFHVDDDAFGVYPSHSMRAQTQGGSRESFSSSEQESFFRTEYEEKYIDHILTPDSNPTHLDVAQRPSAAEAGQGSPFSHSSRFSDLSHFVGIQDDAKTQVQQLGGGIHNSAQAWKESPSRDHVQCPDAPQAGVVDHPHGLQKATRRNLLQRCVPSMVLLPLGLQLPRWLHSLRYTNNLKAGASKQLTPLPYTQRQGAFDPAKLRIISESTRTASIGLKQPCDKANLHFHTIECSSWRGAGFDGESGALEAWPTAHRLPLLSRLNVAHNFNRVLDPVASDQTERPRAVLTDIFTMIGVMAFVVSGTAAFAVSYRHLKPWTWLHHLDSAAAKYSTSTEKDKAPFRATSTLGRGEVDVDELTDETFVNFIQARPTFVLFYAPWCPYCQVLDPTWAALAAALKKAGYDIQLGRMNAEKNPVTADNFKIKKYPTFLFFKEGLPAENGKYLGPRNIDSFMKFIEEKLHQT